MSGISKFLKTRAFLDKVSPKLSRYYERKTAERITRRNNQRINDYIKISNNLSDKQMNMVNSNICALARIAEKFNCRLKFTKREDIKKQPFRIKVTANPFPCRNNKHHKTKDIVQRKIVLNKANEEKSAFIESIKTGLIEIIESLEKHKSNS